MSFFQKQPDPFDDELRKLKAEERRVMEESRRVEESMRRMGEPVPEKPSKPVDPEQFKGAMFKDGDSGHRLPPTRKALKIQKRRMRNRVIVLGVVLLILVILVLKTIK